MIKPPRDQFPHPCNNKCHKERTHSKHPHNTVCKPQYPTSTKHPNIPAMMMTFSPIDVPLLLFHSHTTFSWLPKSGMHCTEKPIRKKPNHRNDHRCSCAKSTGSKCPSCRDPASSPIRSPLSARSSPATRHNAPRFSTRCSVSPSDRVRPCWRDRSNRTCRRATPHAIGSRTSCDAAWSCASRADARPS